MATSLPDDPDAWFDSILRPWFPAFARTEASVGRWVTSAELVDGGRSALAAMHARLVGRRVPDATAATYLCAWYGGPLAELVGAGLATARAAVAVELSSVRWRIADETWADRVNPGTLRMTVAADHPWAGMPGVEVVPSFDDVARIATLHLADTVAPVVEACRRLARVGVAGLWNEIGDACTMAVHRREGLGIDDAMLDVLHRATRTPGVPWRAHARLWLVETPNGTACVGQKGGCCRAYLAPDEEEDDDDPDVAAFWQRFPRPPGAPLYCGTCSLRDPVEAESRQLFWFERRPHRLHTHGEEST